MPTSSPNQLLPPSAATDVIGGDWHARPIGAVLASFGTDGARGLAGVEARRRLARDGPN